MLYGRDGETGATTSSDTLFALVVSDLAMPPTDFLEGSSQRVLFPPRLFDESATCRKARVAKAARRVENQQDVFVRHGWRNEIRVRDSGGRLHPTVITFDHRYLGKYVR